MSRCIRSVFVPKDNETLEKWNALASYFDEDKIFDFPVTEEETIDFWPVADKINDKFNLMIDSHEEEDIPYEYLNDCLKMVNEVERLRDGQIAKALKKGIELKMPVSFYF